MGEVYGESPLKYHKEEIEKLQKEMANKVLNPLLNYYGLEIVSIDDDGFHVDNVKR